MDKQTLKKHHFWILLGLSVPLILIVLAGTVFGVGSAAVEAKAKIDKRNQELTSAAPKCEAYLANLDKQKTELEKQRNKVWEEVYKAQAGLIRWPDRLKQLDRLYFGDKLSEDYRTIFRESDVYLGEYNQLPSIIAPTQFLGGEWERVLRHVPDWQKLPSSEDCWLALENLCVQREILQDIHNVNQLLAQFLPVPQPPDANASAEVKTRFESEKAKVAKELQESLNLKEGEVAGRFISPYWLLDIAAARSATGKPEVIFRGKLTNISDRRQNVSRINFKVWLDANAQPAVVPIEAEFLAAGESLDFSDIRVAATSRTSHIHAVEQVLDLRYAPVKRVDRLVLGYLSNRYANQPLVGPEGPAFKEARDAEGAATPPAPMEGAGRLGGAAAAQSGPSNTSSNGLERNRYLHRTDQVRRMPIGIVLVVDQAHIQDVQRAFANSRLRFQNVQIHWQRFRGTLDGSQSTGGSMSTAPSAGGAAGGGLRPSTPSAGGGVPGPTRPSAGGGAGGATDAGTALPGRPGGRPAPGGSGPPSTGTITQQLPDEAMTSLVELSIYGIASLYERFPPRQTTPETGTPPDPGMPTGSPPVPSAPTDPTKPTPPSLPVTTPAGTGNSTAPPPPPTPPVPPPSPPDGR